MRKDSIIGFPTYVSICLEDIALLLIENMIEWGTTGSFATAFCDDGAIHHMQCIPLFYCKHIFHPSQFQNELQAHARCGMAKKGV